MILISETSSHSILSPAFNISIGFQLKKKNKNLSCHMHVELIISDVGRVQKKKNLNCFYKKNKIYFYQITNESFIIFIV